MAGAVDQPIVLGLLQPADARRLRLAGVSIMIPVRLERSGVHGLLPDEVPVSTQAGTATTPSPTEKVALVHNRDGAYPAFGFSFCLFMSKNGHSNVY